MRARVCMCVAEPACRRRVRRSSSDAPLVQRWFDKDRGTGALYTDDGGSLIASNHSDRYNGSQYSCFSTLVPDAVEGCVITYDHVSPV